MVEVLIALAAGLALGYVLRDRELVDAVADQAMTVLVVVLLFLLGLAAGRDPRVVAGLGSLGLDAVALMAVSTLGSLAATVPLMTAEADP